MSNKSIVCSSRSSCMLLPCTLLLLLLLPAMPDAAAATRRARIAATNSNNSNELLTEAAAAAGKLKTSAESKYEIRGVAGEPNYKSVNLTWEVEFVTSAHDTDTQLNASGVAAVDDGVTNMKLEPPKAFQIFYCEMQNYGPQRCRVKLVNGTAAQLPEAEAEEEEEQQQHINSRVQHFAAAVDNLRMATRYSFHVRPVGQQQQQQRLRSASRARSDFHEENEIESAASAHMPGQSIIVPTKGFSAHATQCLAHASEIEVETGPYFGGRIVVDGGDCGLKGNANDPADKYTMRIDHKLCGSMVKPETNTVETFITVQENLGIFTHSTRRFVVVCSYQSGIQTVRASFTVPGKHAGVAAAVEPNDPFQPDEERLGRELRHMRFVNKSELVLKESNRQQASPELQTESQEESESVEQPASVLETQAPQLELQPQPQQLLSSSRLEQGRALSLSSLNELNQLAETGTTSQLQQQPHTKYAKLVVEQGYNGATWTSARAKADARAHDDDDRNDDDDAADEFYAASLRYISANLGSVLVTVSISVIIISICIVLLQRQQSRSRSSRGSNMRHPSPLGCPSAHLPHKTLPRALQQQQYQCTL